MASDSRTTYTHTETVGDKIVEQIGIHVTDTTDKTFLCPNYIGLSTCGDSSIENKPITGYIETFIRENINDTTDIDTVPDALIAYFNRFTNVPDTTFFVAGYKKFNDNMFEQILWQVFVKSIQKIKTNTQIQGATWAGEIDILSKLIKEVGVKQPDGSYIAMPSNDILWNYFTLKDAVEFSEYAIKTTVDTMKFQNRNKTVGGAIDILILKPNEAFWLKKKSIT